MTTRARRAVDYRLSQASQRRRLRPLRFGQWCRGEGHPLIAISDVTAGDSFGLDSIEHRTVLRGSGRIRFGDDVYVASGVHIVCDTELIVGDHALIGFESLLIDTNLHGKEGEPTYRAPITIGSGSWIGARSTVLPGVTVGCCSIVAANSVVTRDVPDRVLVAGNPARVVRSLNLPADATRAHN